MGFFGSGASWVGSQNDGIVRVGNKVVTFSRWGTLRQSVIVGNTQGDVKNRMT